MIFLAHHGGLAASLTHGNNGAIIGLIAVILIGRAIFTSRD